MRELAGKLSALDPEASATLKVIEYFDRLVDGRVGVEGMLQGAAVLSGAPVGHRTGAEQTVRRFDADGSALPAAEPDGWPSVSFGDEAIVWLERSGQSHANDAMILERLAISLSIQSQRLDSLAPTRRAVETLLLGDASEDEREQAATRLMLPAQTPIHAIAVPPSEPLDRDSTRPHPIVATRFGVVRALLSTDEADVAARAGIGIAAHSTAEIRGSWRSALIALRLCDESRPVVRAADLGVLLHVAEGEDHRSAVHPDVLAIDRAIASNWTEHLLREVAAGASRRSLAGLAGLHHSTMDARLRKLPSLLGYDPGTATGRTRLDVTLMLHRLAHTRIDGAA